MARLFNGSGDQAVTSSVPTTAVDNVTYCAWVNVGASVANNSFPFTNGTSGSAGYGVRILNLSGSTFNFGAIAMGQAQGAFNASATTGTWYHVLILLHNFSVDGNSTGYQNGVLDSNTFTLAAAAPTGGAAMSAITNCNCTVADFAIWTTFLSAGEISALGKYGARPYQIRPQNLVYWAPLDGLQSPEPDLSGSKLNATLTGTTLAAGPPIMQITPRWPQRATEGPAPPIPELQNFNAFMGRRVAVIGY